MKQLKICKTVTKTPLKHINEGEVANNKKYEFLGIFTQCSTPDKKIVNRNNRVYMEKEVLRHLGYLREMIEEQGGILGELDHPEGRFDVLMQSASHMITDLWYDDNTKCVMGKLKVLDTPNGLILRELIDAGYPLYVSSRAAGDVNEKTKEVEIAQIFTYDVVCTPGFKEAKLERINESLSTGALKYINESVSAAKTVKEDVLVEAGEIDEALVEKFANTRIKDVNKPLNEDEDASDAAPVGMLPVMGGNNAVKEDGDDESDEEKEEKDDEEKKDDKDDDKDEKDDKDVLSDEEKEKNRKLILDIIGVVDDEEATEDEDGESKKDDIIDIEAKGEDEGEDENAENESKHKCKSADQIKKEADKDIDGYESLLASIKKAETVKESIVARYPFAISLSEANFAKFAALRPKLKKRCADFIEEYQIYDVNAINELWTTPLREDKRMQQNWLRLASKTDIDLYCQAPLEVQNAIEEQASMIPLETQEDVDIFWERMGLRRANADRMLNERMNKQMQDARSGKQTNSSYNLGYSQDWIAMAEEMMK